MESNNDFESQLSPEQRLELEKSRTDRAKAESEAAQAKASLDATAAETRKSKEKAAFAEALDASKVRFHSNFAETQHLVSTMFDIVESGGKVTAIDKETGKTLPLIDAIQHAALSHPTWCDQRTLKSLRETEEGSDEPKVRSKSDLKTAKEKAEHIEKVGLDAWEKLPLNPPEIVNLKTLTFESYKNLSLADKVALIKKHGENFAATLPREGDLAAKLARGGIRVNRTGR